MGFRSIANQALQSSLWPIFLRSDTWNPSDRVRPWIRVLSFALPLTTLLAAITGIVTPLGLSDEIISITGSPDAFQYVQDTSPYSAGTSPRGNTNFTRHCSGGETSIEGPVACPYTGDVVEVTEFGNGSIRWHFPNDLTAGIPNVLRDIFSSGTAGRPTTISNFFDIEWRQLSTVSIDHFDGGTKQTVGQYRQLDSFILQDDYRVLEGLVVDAREGGIGFRNHTLPTGTNRGGTWTEDLLFVEPKVSCVNTNLTFDFEVTSNYSELSAIRNFVITDRGGFADLDTSYSVPDRTLSQDNPALQERAYDAAFLHNAHTMMIYNVTNPSDNETGRAAFAYLDSEIGKSFALNASRGLESHTGLGLSSKFSSYVNPTGDGLDGFPNPHNITLDKLGNISADCAGSSGEDRATISNIQVKCGLLQGAPVRVDDGPPAIFDNGSKWSSPLHSCAATVRATVKTVGFSFNATSRGKGLEGLSVTSIEPKSYAGEDDYPLWGFEESGMEFDGISAIWGLISDDYESHENVSSVRKPIFHIPGVSEGLGAETLNPGLPYANNLPGSDFAAKVLNEVFQIDGDWPYDLRGTASMSLFDRWQSLSTDSSDAAKIIRLLWTDLAASAVVGAKGALGQRNSGGGVGVPADFRPFARRVTYNPLYGIPAFVFLLFIAIILSTALATMGLGKASIALVRQRIRQLSAGRIFTTYLFPKESSLTMESSEWRSMHGASLVSLGSTGTRHTSSEPESPLQSGAEVSKPLLVEK